MDEYIFNIEVLGNTGVGKSSLCNMLAYNQNAFKVGDEGTSQTQLTSETQLTVYKEFKFMGKPDGIKLRLVDTQGLSDTGGDTKDMQHIKNMVERIRELETIDLFLLCLDGMNPRFTAYKARFHFFQTYFRTFYIIL
jgi:predicted GTPase